MNDTHRFRRNTLATIVAMSCAAWGASATAGEVLDLDYTTGDGFVFYDEADGLLEPGVKVVTGLVNNDEANGTTPSEALNCIMSNRDGVVCDSPPRSSKRVKNHLTGMGAFDTVYTTAPTGGTTEYFNFGKITNDTGARMTGFKVIVGTGTGSNFVAADDSAVAGLLRMDDLDGDNQDPRATVPCGLFGYGCGGTGGDPDPEVGYFDTDGSNDSFSFVLDGTDTLVASNLSGDYLTIVGDGLLSSNQVPDGLFIDDGNPDTEDDLLYWNTGTEWRDGDNNPVDQATIDAAMARGDTYVDVIEDMANSNINYSFDIADISGLTVRFVPMFAPIVEQAGSDYQFAVAGSLDSSQIAYLDQAIQDGYGAIIDDIMALGTTAERQQALERSGTSYLRNFGTQSFLIGRDQMDQVLSHLSRGRMGTIGTTSGQMNARATSVEDISAIRLASADSSPQALAGLMAGTGSNGSMAITDRFSVFFSGSVSQGDIDSTTNGAGADYDGYSLTGGADYRFFENTRFGAAVGYGENDASVVDGRGDLKVDGTTAMLYGSYGQATGPFVDAAAGYSWLDYDNDRYIVFGNTNERAQSDTDGTQKSFTLGGGYNFELGRLIAGPSARFEYHDLDVDGYQETGADLLSMSVEDMDFKSRTMWFGGQVAMPMELDNGGSLRPHASLHFVREFEDEAGAVQTNFTGGTLPFTTPLDGRDDSYVRAGLGLDASFTSLGQPMTVSLNYDGTLDNDDYDEHRGSVSVTMHF